MRFPYVVLLSACALTLALPLLAQSPNGVLNGLVVDPSNQVIVGADIICVNDVTGVQYAAKTNGEGIYVLPSLPPGPYRLQVSKVGFKTLIKPDIILNVQDALAINFTLPVGALSETVTVEGGAPLVNTESAAVSTVVDRQFAENLPMNGRSFQTLIQLTPGVVLTTSNPSDSGQFSVNGQRASSNYWMVDGVSANIGVGVNLSTSPGNGLSGSLGSFSALGGTNSLVSVDALQEFRIQTSTYAPEFGRAPGGQISIVTRSGTNRFHGTLFDYFRNDVLDSSSWFNGYTNDPPLKKAEERQNDFGGTFSGPLLKNRTFFFFSYEGLRLRLPQTALTTVPDTAARQDAVAALQPFLAAYPLPNGPDNVGTGIAQFRASYSNPGTLDAYSIRIDHKLTNKVSLFGRYNYSPSDFDQRGITSSLSTVSLVGIGTQTATIGTTWMLSPTLSNDLRFNYSRTSASRDYETDNFGGAVPMATLPFPTPFTADNAQLYFNISSLVQGFLHEGRVQSGLQRQVNVLDNLSIAKGSHTLRFGIDYRRLSPVNAPYSYLQGAFLNNVTAAENGQFRAAVVSSSQDTTLLFQNLGVYAQDSWNVVPRLTLTYGVRWDVDFVPRSIEGPTLSAVTGFNLQDLSNLALAPVGTPAYKTTYGNLAPRVGAAYQLRKNPYWQSVLRGGFGLFYDLASSEMGNQISAQYYPFGSTAVFIGGTLPLDPAMASPPPVTPPNATNGGILSAVDPHLRLPYTLEWNVALEQAFGNQQAFTASYVGAAGRRLLQSGFLSSPNPNFGETQLLANAGTSDYDALQLQFHRRFSQGLQAFASYTWAHSIDTASAGSNFISANILVPGIGPNANRGPSDFDIRNAFSVGATYDIPSPKIGGIGNAVLRGWSLQNVVQGRSASPVDISDVGFFEFNSGSNADVRPDLVPQQPLYVSGSQCSVVFGALCPGGKGFNPAAFTDPPIDPVTGNPVRQGNTPRNFLRGFGAIQWDLAVHRDFPIHELVKLQFRAEFFNVLNHPNFGQPNGQYLSPVFGGPAGFGLSTETLAQSLNGDNLGAGAFNPLYQIGGPRSVQLALKLMF